MPSTKRLKSVCQRTAHHAVSGLSNIHPHLRQACDSLGVLCAKINLKEKEPCPGVFRHIEPLRLSLNTLRRKCESILETEGFTVAEIKTIELTFYFPSEFEDDYRSICESEIVSETGHTYRYVVDILGNARAPNTDLQNTCLQQWQKIVEGRL